MDTKEFLTGLIKKSCTAWLFTLQENIIGEPTSYLDICPEPGNMIRIIWPKDQEPYPSRFLITRYRINTVDLSVAKSTIWTGDIPAIKSDLKFDYDFLLNLIIDYSSD